MTVPEAATLLFTNGAKFETPISFQLAVLRVQMALENNFESLAQVSNEPAVILCDRGLMDGSAYVDTSTWEEIMRLEGVKETDIRDARYDAVIHMVTAADGAEEYYTLANNASRHETVAEARSQDKKTQQAWTGHSRLHVIGNEVGSGRTLNFQQKIGSVIDAVKASIGLVCFSPKYERRYLVSKMITPKDVPRDSKSKMQKVHKFFFSSSRKEFLYSYVQEKCDAETSSNVTPMYSHCTFRKIDTEDGLAEERNIITQREFWQISQQQSVVGESRSMRVSFMYEKFYVQFESFGACGVVLLRVQPPRGLEVIPDFFDEFGVRKIKDVTFDEDYSQINIARKWAHTREGTQVGAST